MARGKQVDRGKWVAARLRTELAQEARDARLTAGLSQRQVAHAAGLSQPKVSRVENAESGSLKLEELVRLFAVLGLRLSVRAYPDGTPVRDQAQLRLLERLRSLIAPAFAWASEVPVAGRADLRAWDARLDGPVRIGIDAETRLHDIQALQRRQELKWRDGAVDRVVLVVADSRHNRQVLREHREALRSTYELDSRPVLAALRSGIDPGANGLIVI